MVEDRSEWRRADIGIGSGVEWQKPTMVERSGSAADDEKNMEHEICPTESRSEENENVIAKNVKSAVK